MSRQVRNAVFLSPDLGDRYRAGEPVWLREAVDDLIAQGIVVFLSSLDAAGTAGACAWYLSEPVRAKPGYENLRLLTPSRFMWPEGVVHMPLDTTWDATLMARAHALVRPLMSEPAVARLETSGSDDFLSIASGAIPDPGWVADLWRRCAGKPVLVPGDPGALESRKVGDGWSTVLAPDVPSVAWASAVVEAEVIDPSRLLILSAVDESAAASMEALPKALLAAAGDDFGPRVECAPTLPVDVAGERLALPDGDVLAPRISASSDIHFVRRWTEANQRYVRGRYWEATRQARANAAKGAELLRNLDATRFRRVADMLELAGKRHGERLFDDYSGGVCFDPGFYEFDLRRDVGDPDVDALRRGLLAYFDAKVEEMPFDRPLLRRRMFTNSLVLLRGEGYYTNLKEVPPWRRARDFLVEADALQDLFGTIAGNPDMSRALTTCLEGGEATRQVWKLLVGALDQARNLGLIMLSVAAYRWGEAPDQVDPLLLEKAVTLVKGYYQVLLGDARVGEGKLLAWALRDAIINGKAELEELAKREEALAKGSDWYDPGKPIRGWREADNPYENLLTSLLALDCGDGEAKGTAVLGMFWGGVELPIVAAVAADAMGVELATWGFRRHGRYSSAATRSDSFYCDLKAGKWREMGDIAGMGASRTLLMDDNSLTGQTLETARDMLLAAGAENVETWVVRFSGERREGQMRMADGGIVHPAYLRQRIKGYLGETPYARSYSRKHFQSPVGVFDTARSRVLRYLHNNGFASVFEREGF